MVLLQLKGEGPPTGPSGLSLLEMNLNVCIYNKLSLMLVLSFYTNSPHLAMCDRKKAQFCLAESVEISDVH